MCRWGCQTTNTTYMCKWCGTRYCKECLRGDFQGHMSDGGKCRICNQSEHEDKWFQYFGNRADIVNLCWHREEVTVRVLLESFDIPWTVRVETRCQGQRVEYVPRPPGSDDVKKKGSSMLARGSKNRKSAKGAKSAKKGKKSGTKKKKR